MNFSAKARAKRSSQGRKSCAGHLLGNMARRFAHLNGLQPDGRTLDNPSPRESIGCRSKTNRKTRGLIMKLSIARFKSLALIGLIIVSASAVFAQQSKPAANTSSGKLNGAADLTPAQIDSIIRKFTAKE